MSAYNYANGNQVVLEDVYSIPVVNEGFTVELRSDIGGGELFDYNTLKEAIEGAVRLAVQSWLAHESDGSNREIRIIIGGVVE